MTKEKNNKSNKPKFDGYIKYSGIASQMMIIICAGVFGGLKLDEYCQTKPIFTAILSVISVLFAIYYSIKDLINHK